MRMDENSNPEWKQMLSGISAGRKALEVITNLEAQLAECQRERDHYKKRHEQAVTNALHIATQRDALRDALQSIADDPVIHEPRHVTGERA